MSHTQTFFELTPEAILDSVEEVMQREEPELRATGRALALNSLENRVYDIELEDDSHVVAKFYRPGRWTEDQILEEHGFLFALDDAEIPVVSPLDIDGESLFESKQGILFALFPKVKGRLLDELDEERLRTLGRYIGRIHNVGEHYPFDHRLKLSADVWAREPMKYLLASPLLSPEYHARYSALGTALADRISAGLEGKR